MCSEPCSYYVTLGQREVANIALSHSKLLYVADKGHKCRYLIDTGAAVSVLPKSCANGISDAYSLPLVAANNSTIHTYGKAQISVDVHSGRCAATHNRRIAIAPPLTAPYDGPYKVVARSGRVMKILVKGKGETVSLDRVKPAHLECEPTTGTTIQRKTPNKPQRSTATRTSSRNPQGSPRTGSAETRTSNGTSVKTKKSTAVRSSQKSATVPKQLDVKVNLSNRDNTYVAPHSRAPAVSCANGNGGGLRTYSRLPLHLRGKTQGAADAVID